MRWVSSPRTNSAGPPGEPPPITVEFDLDLNGILKVSATDRGSRQVTQTTLHAAHTRLSPVDQAASARYLDELWETTAAAAEASEEAGALEPFGESVEMGDADPLLARGACWSSERAS